MLSQTANSLVVVLAAAIWVTSGSTVISYYCITDGTIWVENPDPSLFISASAANNVTNCNVAMTDDKVNITISGCAKEINILFTLSARPQVDGIVGGNASTLSYVIHCAEIPEEGVKFTRNLYVDIITDTQTPPRPEPVTPKFTLETNIWTTDYTLERTSGFVSEHLKWRIAGPAEYDILPLTCTAYSGTTVGGSPSQIIVTNGCSNDNSLLRNFALIGSQQDSIAADFYVFKYYNSDHLTLACTVLTCPRGSPACDLNCSKRKRRQADKYSVLADPNLRAQEFLIAAHLDVSMFAKASLMGPTNTAVILSVWSVVIFLQV